MQRNSKVIILLSVVAVLLIASIFIFNNYETKAEKEFNICDQTWYNYRLPNALPNESIVLRNVLAVKWIEECK